MADDDGAPSHHCYCVPLPRQFLSYTRIPEVFVDMVPRTQYRKLGLHRSLPTQDLDLTERSVGGRAVSMTSFSLCKFPNPPNFNPPNAIHSLLEPIRQI